MTQRIRQFKIRKDHLIDPFLFFSVKERHGGECNVLIGFDVRVSDFILLQKCALKYVCAMMMPIKALQRRAIISQHFLTNGDSALHGSVIIDSPIRELIHIGVAPPMANFATMSSLRKSGSHQSSLSRKAI